MQLLWYMKITFLCYVSLDDACALGNNTQDMLSRAACQLCAASCILKPNSLVDIPHSCRPCDHITYLSMFTAKGENLLLRTPTLSADKTQLSLKVFVHSVYWRRHEIDHCFVRLLSSGATLNQLFLDGAYLGSEGVWMELLRGQSLEQTPTLLIPPFRPEVWNSNRTVTDTVVLRLHAKCGLFNFSLLYTNSTKSWMLCKTQLCKSLWHIFI